jgi:hypothetical protein
MKLNMKLFKVAGIILAAIFAVSMFASATASAAKPVWEHCASGAAGTKWTNGNCTTASSGGTFGWTELTGTESVRVKGSLLLVDTETIAGRSEVECSGETIGFIGPGKFGQTTKVEVSPAQCRPIKNCEKVEGVEARNLPWQSEISEVGGKKFSKLVSGTGGEPGWKLTCKVIFNFTDECLQVAGKTETQELVNKPTGSELLVLATFSRTFKAHCSQSGKESGEVIGSLAILLTTGGGIRVS